MFSVTRLWPTLTRALVLTLLSGAHVLLPLGPAAATHGGSHSTNSDLAFWGNLAGTEPRFHFTFRVDVDGSARVHGETHPPDADPPAVLVAIRDSAVATFDDLDGDGDLGLSRLTMQLRHPSTTEIVSFIFEPIQADIDASGTYDVTLTVGTTTRTTAVKVRVKPDRSERHR